MSPPAMLDSHLHLWDLAVRDQAWIPAESPIRRSFDVRDLRSVLAGTPVDGVILVQVINDADETADFIDCARTVDLVRGVVGWADLTSPDFAATLSALTSTGFLLGIRHQALAEADPAGWLRSPGVQRSLAVLDAAGLPFDLVIRPAHFPAARGAARAHPRPPVRAAPPRQAADRRGPARAVGLRPPDARRRTQHRGQTVGPADHRVTG